MKTNTIIKRSLGVLIILNMLGILFGTMRALIDTHNKAGGWNILFQTWGIVVLAGLGIIAFFLIVFFVCQYFFEM